MTKFVPPFANNLMARMRMRTKGKYAKGWPVGAVVHFTAGRGTGTNVISGGIKDGYTYWVNDRSGQLWCAHSADEWGYHAGESAWKKMLKKLIGGVSDDLIGIENIAAGKVDAQKDGTFKTWYGATLRASEVRESKGVANQAKGFYEKFTSEQEHTLTETLLWLKAQHPTIFDFDFVLGHDEVSGPMGIGYWRKTDPGAALSMTMPEYREFLKQKWAARVAGG